MKDLPSPLRPREKLLGHGAATLEDPELLALLLRTGYRGCGVMALAHQVLRECDGMAGLLQATPQSLARVKGLGPAKRAELLAVTEVARRATRTRLQTRPVLDHPLVVKQHLALQLGGRSREVFAVLFLDAGCRLLALEEMFLGTLTQTSVHPREVVKRALALNAAAVVLAHNHPSGRAEPSRADEAVTRTLQQALALVDVRVLDHLVVGDGEVTSFAERGLI